MDLPYTNDAFFRGKTDVTRHNEFKAFFSATNPIVPTPSTITHPSWEINPCLKHMIRASKECMFIVGYIYLAMNKT